MLKNKSKIVSLLTALTLTIGLITPVNVVKAETNGEQQEINLQDGQENENASEIVENSDETNESGKDTVTIEVLGTTDLHGKFKNYEYATTSQAAGGFNQIASVVKTERANNENILLLDNGDTIQGNYNHLFLTKEYLSENINPIALGLTEIGYDAFTLGNHEFNYGMDILDSIASQVEAGGTSVLCANLYKDGERVFDPYVIKEYEGIRVAVIGVVTNHITKWDADKLVGYEPTNPAEEVRKVIDELKADNAADLYVVSAHVGLTEEYGDGDSAISIAELNPEVAMILAGHSHVAIVEEIVNGVLITQPKNNGAAVSKVTLEVEKTEDGVNVINRKAEHINLEKDSQVDAYLDGKLDFAHNIALNDANSVIGKLVGENLAANNEVKGIPESFVSDQGVTDLINEVQLYYSAKHLESLGIDASEVHHVSGAAMLSATANLEVGNITKAGLANIYKFDNKLYTIKTTGKQIKKYLEWTADFYNTFEEGDLTISFNSNFASFKYDMLTGVNYEINLSKPVGNRIEQLTYNDGTKVAEEDVVYLTVNDYRYSSNLALLFDDGEHEKIYESTNDSLSDVRDMIAEYIVEVKDGIITKSVDNNWRLTGVNYNEKLRSEVVKLINDGTISANSSYGVIIEPLNWTDVSTQLTAKGLTEKLQELKDLVGKTVDVLSFNDLHGNVLESGKNIGAAKLAGVINKYQSKESDIYSVIPVVGGDAYQGTSISNLTKGEPVNEMIKAIGAKVSAVGNHEFDWDRSDFSTWQEQGGFDFVAANIVYKESGELADFVKPYIILESNGVKIAFIGIATTDTPTSTKAEKVEDLDFLDPVETMNKWAPIVRAEGADVVIALTHSGATENSDGTIVGEAADIAREANDVDGVIAAHNHKFVDGFVTNNNGKEVAVVQGGYNGRGLARIRFNFDSENNLISMEAYTHVFADVQNELPINEEILASMKQWEADLEPLFSVKVAYLEEELAHDRNNGLTPLGVTVAEAMRTIGGTQIAIANGGGIRRELRAGDVTVGDMYEILPFDNQLVTLELKGEDLVKVIEHGINPSSFGWGQFAGLKVWYDENGNVTSMRLEDGTKIKMDEYYTVTTIDFLITGGDSYDFSNSINIIDTMEVMREGIQALWQEEGIKALDYDLLIQGEDTTIDGSTDEEGGNTGNGGNTGEGGNTGNDGKPDTEVTPDDNNGIDSENNEKLPNTGAPFSSLQIAMLAIVAVTIGTLITKEKKRA